MALVEILPDIAFIVDALAIEALGGCRQLPSLFVDSWLLASGLDGWLSLTSVILLSWPSQWSLTSDLASIKSLLTSRSPIATQ